jgi:dihydropteroate synthase
VYKRPDRRRLLAIRDRLRREYGRPVLRAHRAPVDELVLTVLSQNTNDRNRDVAYHRLRERFPDVRIMMGTGNLTELTEADTSGIHALLLGLCAELDVGAILTTQVSPHARRAVAEADWARRIMHAAKRLNALPKGISPMLSTMHAKRPFPDSPDEIAALAAQVRDPSFRVQVSELGIHVYNRDGLRLGRDAFALWPALQLEHDASHAFYMGVELARAEIAWQLGKRYVQDQPLDWGCAVDPDARVDDACGPPSPPPGPAEGAVR